MPELVELAQIQGVKGYRARQLFNAGLRTIQAVAESDPSTLEAIFNKGVIFATKLWLGGWIAGASFALVHF